jgi:hypothetical protein
MTTISPWAVACQWGQPEVGQDWACRAAPFASKGSLLWTHLHAAREVAHPVQTRGLRAWDDGGIGGRSEWPLGAVRDEVVDRGIGDVGMVEIPPEHHLQAAEG